MQRALAGHLPAPGLCALKPDCPRLTGVCRWVARVSTRPPDLVFGPCSGRGVLASAQLLTKGPCPAAFCAPPKQEVSVVLPSLPAHRPTHLEFLGWNLPCTKHPRADSPRLEEGTQKRLADSSPEARPQSLYDHPFWVLVSQKDWGWGGGTGDDPAVTSRVAKWISG